MYHYANHDAVRGVEICRKSSPNAREVSKRFARPEYTLAQAVDVCGWLNGTDWPLLYVNQHDRPKSIPERIADNHVRAFNGAYDANARRRGQYD